MWGATGSYLHIQTRAASDTGSDAAGNTLTDRTHALFNGGTLQVSLSGPAFSLPAGLVMTNLRLGLLYQGFDTQDAPPGAASVNSDLSRVVRSASFNTSLPLASRDRGVLTRVGDLAATVNVSLDHVSQFGSLLSYSYGLDWLPLPHLHFNAIVTDKQSAPTVQQVLAPPIYTPNVELYDFVNGETATVTTIAGGDARLRKTDARTASAGVSIGPVFERTVLSAHYERTRAADAVGSLPPLTADLEQAFPERFTRDAAGTLIVVDNRAINLARQVVEDLKWGFSTWLPMGARAAGRSMPNRVEFALFDTWYLHDEFLVRAGVPPLDLLDGAPFDASGGQPRHKVEWRTLVYREGLGASLSGTWRSGTHVGNVLTGGGDRLDFSALGTLDLRLFADFERLPLTRRYPAAKGARLALAVFNVANQRQRVRDSSGATPVAFEPGYLDPAGRNLWLTLRKVF